MLGDCWRSLGLLLSLEIVGKGGNNQADILGVSAFSGDDCLARALNLEARTNIYTRAVRINLLYRD